MTPLVVAAAATVTTLLGGWVARHVDDRRHLVLGLAAGLMLGIVGFDLLPEALASNPGEVFGVPVVLLLFVAGFLVLHVVERSVAIHRAHEGEYAPHTHAHGPTRDPHGGTHGLGLAAAGALVGHSLFDGFAIGAALQAGGTTGAVVAVAVIAHDFADGFNTYTITRLYGNNRRRGYALVVADAIAPLAGAAVTLAFTIPERILGLYLGFFGGFLLYLATSDILPEAHSPHPSRGTLLLTVTGAALMWLVIGLAH
ncbi:ZIP family metal transporter [Dactylosporangium aurantiacum]|uniref:ZIP family metal transporter n=1 Tax=Dactylosporangium aurantiacum TaxID=35754 RepID=A0A9Q9IMI1_9ACTN|nr:ZIP family metal transporter [Dactylosporangium aurantiacum]MDG6103922.1 ZIP family metal transporter [Dactylosporangium aurantiacum]UWZ58889.1 ZIP family metal transporter [Dactylosporangium aurantiacum]